MFRFPLNPAQTPDFLIMQYPAGAVKIRYGRIGYPVQPAFIKFSGSGKLVKSYHTYLEVVLQAFIKGKALHLWITSLLPSVEPSSAVISWNLRPCP